MRCLLISIFLWAGTAYAGTAHLYNLTDGKVTVLKFSRWRGDHGPLYGVMASGEILLGEYSITRAVSPLGARSMLPCTHLRGMRAAMQPVRVWE
jgi:hypothetical protein